MPAFMLFVGLIIFGGRTAITHQAVESAAADGARAASIERTSSRASEGGRRRRHTSLPQPERPLPRHRRHGRRRPVQPAVGQTRPCRVTVTCRLDLSDLSVPGVPGSRLITATMTSPIDT